jgi:protein-disulfide isomerase
LQTHQKLVAEVVQDLGREVLIGDSPTLGNPDASVVLLEFSDFQCPYCARAKEQISTFTVAHQEEVLLVFKHLPLTNIHPEALPAAQAAWAAGQQGKFWEFHDALFAQQESLGEDLYLKTAQTLGLNLEQFNRDRTSEMAQAAIAKDLALASELQLTGTPTFIMNELLIPGAVPAEFLSEALTRLQSAQSPATSSPTEVQ